MDSNTLVADGMNALGLGAYVPVVLAGIGFFSVVSVFYPSNWKGASFIKKAALVLGHAKTPATTPVTTAIVEHL